MRRITTYTTVANTKENNKIKTMKKSLMIIAAILTTLGFAYAQTTATDFTADDCNGVSHNLFSELDSGDIIVISWVMPCGGCVNPSLEAYYAVESFASSHPGRVHFYVADDAILPIYQTCSSLPTWGDNNNMPNSTFFVSADVNMNGYGTPGMPKVVVLGGSQHTIFYNQNNQNPNFNGVQNAITNALSGPIAADQSLSNNFEISTYPNPVNSLLNITYSKIQSSSIKFSIVDLSGKVVLSSKEQLYYSLNKSIKSINISSLTNGNYFLEIASENLSESIPFIVSH